MKASRTRPTNRLLMAALAVLLFSNACGKSVAGQGGGNSNSGDGGGTAQGSGGDPQGAAGSDANDDCDVGDLSCLDLATPAVCDSNGERIALPRCTGDHPICTEGICTVCKPGAFECQSNAPATCNEDGSGFNLGAECSGDTPACLLSARACGRCAAGSTDCQDNTVLECSDGEWTQSEQCSGSTPYCLAGTCVECEGEAARDCADDTPRLCVDGEWVPEAQCSGDTPACDEATTRCACAVGATKCRALDTPETCNADHVWENNGERCFGNTPVCDDGICICSEGQKRCENPQAVAECKNADWAAPTACPSATPVCTGDGECVECVTHDDCAGGGLACIDNHCTSTYKAAGLIACGDQVCGTVDCCASGDSPSCYAECHPTACSTSWDTSYNRFRCDGDNDCAAGLECHVGTYSSGDCPNGAVGSICTDTGEGAHACDPDEAGACAANETCSLVWPQQMPTFYACQ